MDMTQTITAPSAFEALHTEIAGLRAREANVDAGHVDLGAGLWMSCDPEGQTRMSSQAGAEGFRLTIERGDSGQWSCLGMRLPFATLAEGRYIGLLIEAESEALVSFTPRLRYFFRGGGMEDVGTPLPVVLPIGRHRSLSHIEIDPERMERTEGCELNLFFHSDHAVTTVTRMEPLLIR